MVNPRAVEAMREVGIDLHRHHSKGLADLPEVDFDVVVAMGCGDACPHLRARQRLDWHIPDPRNMSPEQFRTVRDVIEQQVKGLLAEILDAVPVAP
jgi:protein-tyrosine-phosphatase